jgi:hypothetical protein
MNLEYYMILMQFSQTAHMTAVKRLTTRITKMELSYFLHVNGI